MPSKQTPADPYAILGLEPGASTADVKRAYRQLAKAFHPDSAGEQAMPRFLAIQAAYEQIRTGRVTLGGSRAGRGSAAPAAAPSEPWRADPARARAARERARTAGAGTGAKASSSGGGPTRSGSASGAGTGGGPAAGGRRATGTSGTSGGGTPRRRATRKATMGSTSYDEARDPADATWSGASWYGPSTGEYWIVNPREYADPRKHGPDYQQRARRPVQGAGVDPDPASATFEEPVESTAAQAAQAAQAARAEQRSAPRPAAHARPTPRWESQASETGWTRAGDARAADALRDGQSAPPLRWLGEPADDPIRRLALALVAWPPIGLAIAALIGDATGCATFGAQCDGPEPMLPWLAQALILGLLLLLPPLTRVLAGGTIAVLVGVVPVTAFLLAVGAGGAPEAAPTLAVLLATIWLVGVAWATAMRIRRPGAAT